MDEGASSARVRPSSQRASARRSSGVARPNIADIAALANVSTSAVSYALNGREGVAESTRQRIIEIAESLNWRPSSAARALIAERAGAVGIVNIHDPEHSVLSSDFAAEFLIGVQDELRRHDSLLAMYMAGSEAEAVGVFQRWLGERRVDGVLVLNPLRDDPRLTWLEREPLPAVVIGDVRGSSTLVSCWSDTAEATDLVVDHLVGLGHRRIARVSGTPRFAHTQDRAAAFRRSLTRHGLKPDARVRRGRSSVAAIRTAVRDEADPLTAILVEETTTAVEILAALALEGIEVPDEVSIVSLDDVPRTTIVRPSLTVLHREVDEYGRRAARALLRVVEDGVREHERGTFSTLVARESSGPARRAGTTRAASD